MKKIIYILLLLSFSLFLFLNQNKETNIDNGVLSTTFNKEEILNIKISFDEDNYVKLYGDVSLEEYVSATVIINDEIYYNVGVRTKGQDEYKATTTTYNPNYKWSYRVKFDKFVEGQTYHGLTDIALNNNVTDITNIKEVIAYDMFSKNGVKTPYNTFGNVVINNQNFGLYTVVEVIKEPFLVRYYGEDYGNLYKPDNSVTGKQYKGASLKFKGYDTKLYSAIFDRTETIKTNDQDNITLMNILDNINNGNMDNVNIDSFLNYMAVSNVLVLTDTYLGILTQNYYLYENDKIIEIIPFDLNIYINHPSIRDNYLNYPIKLDYFQDGECVKPIVCNVYEDEQLYSLYKKKLIQVIETNINNGYIISQIDKYDQLIESNIDNEYNRYSYEEYKTSLKHFKLFFKERSTYITKQIYSNNIPIDEKDYTADSSFDNKYVVREVGR
ncbi:MAG: CotH kinase family protein [bacterium]|nr:CotH kinase family protein [bacterium]